MKLMGDETAPSKSSPLINLAKLAQVAGGGAGLALGHYSGINLIIPGAIAAVAFAACKHVFPPDKQAAVPAISFQLGEFGWMLLAFMVPGGLQQVAPDLVLMAIGMIWLYLTLGRTAAVAAIIYNVVCLAFYGYELPTLGLASAGMKSLVVHIVWRIVTIILAIAFIHARRSKITEASGAPETRLSAGAA